MAPPISTTKSVDNLVSTTERGGDPSVVMTFYRYLTAPDTGGNGSVSDSFINELKRLRREEDNESAYVYLQAMFVGLTMTQAQTQLQLPIYQDLLNELQEEILRWNTNTGETLINMLTGKLLTYVALNFPDYHHPDVEPIREYLQLKESSNGGISVEKLEKMCTILSQQQYIEEVMHTTNTYQEIFHRIVTDISCFISEEEKLSYYYLIRLISEEIDSLRQRTWSLEIKAKLIEKIFELVTESPELIANTYDRWIAEPGRVHQTLMEES